jgi:hypothetical protein
MIYLAGKARGDHFLRSGARRSPPFPDPRADADQLPPVLERGTFRLSLFFLIPRSPCLLGFSGVHVPARLVSCVLISSNLVALGCKMVDRPAPSFTPHPIDGIMSTMATLASPLTAARAAFTASYCARKDSGAGRLLRATGLSCQLFGFPPPSEEKRPRLSRASGPFPWDTQPG